jgi:hypothetical protein
MTKLKLKIHVKILKKPRTSRSVEKMIKAMKEIYGPAKIDVKLASTEVLDLNDPRLAELSDLDVGSCSRDQLTDEQKQLAKFRNGVADREIVIYVCHSLSDAYGGCAVHPDSKPMAAISAKNARLYTLAHEVGHLLGLAHATVEDPSLLMNATGSPNLKPVPALTPSEIVQMRNSPFLT